MKFRLLGEKTNIEVDVLRRNYPESGDYWDVNWVQSNIKIEIPGYLVSFIADLRTDELREFLNQLKFMNQFLKGKASLKNLDGYIQFDCNMDRLGKITWTCETCYPLGDGAVLTFSFDSDQTFLNSLINELDALLTAFPVIGIP